MRTLRLGPLSISFGRAVAPAAFAQSKGQFGALLSGLASSGRWGFAKEANKAQRLAAYTGYVHTCVSARALRDAAARYVLYDNRTGEDADISSLPIQAAFFSRPNPVMSWNYMMQIVHAWLMLAGTAPLLKIRNAAGVPVMAWPLLPNRVTALYDPIDWMRFEYVDDAGQTIKIPGRDMIFFRKPHPTKLFDGLGDLEGAGLFHDTDQLLWSYQSEMFRNGPFASWILQYPAENRTLTPEEASRVAANFEQIVSDRVHPAYPVVLSGGAEAKSFPVTNKGLEVPTINEEVKERIRSAFCVSKTILGEVEGYSRANVEGAEYGFARTSDATLALIADELQRSLLPEWDENLTGSFLPQARDDRDADLRETVAYVSAGVMTIGEAREKIGLGDLAADESGDAGGVQSAGVAPGAPQADVQATALNGAQVDSLAGILDKVAAGAMSKTTAAAFIAATFPGVAADQVDAMLGGIVVAASSAPLEQKSAAQLAARAADPGERRAELSRKFVAWQEPLEKKMLGKLRAILAAEADAVVKKIDKFAPRTMDAIAGCATRKAAHGVLAQRSAIDDIADMDDLAEEYAKLRPYLLEIYTDAGQAAVEGHGMAFEVNAKGITKIGNHLDKSTDAILKTTAGQIRDALQEGFLEGEGVGDLSQRIRDLYDGISKGRARTIARTETVAPANMGTLSGYQQAGIGKKEWIATLDGHARDAHESASGQTVAVDDDFTVDGEDIAYPGDDRGSAGNVINCRCTIAAVVED